MSMRLPLLVPLLAVACAEAPAQQPPPPAPPPPQACTAPEHRQFDFWLGSWDVTGGPKLDTLVGRNTITKVSSGCALAEHWVNGSGQDGHTGAPASYRPGEPPSKTALTCRYAMAGVHR